MLKILQRYFSLSPILLIVHLKTIIEFAQKEIESSIISYKKKLILKAIGLFFIGAGILCGSFSIILWGALPQLNPTNSWILVALPIFMIVIGAIFCYFSGNMKKF